jgi:hypothetical protein
VEKDSKPNNFLNKNINKKISRPEQFSPKKSGENLKGNWILAESTQCGQLAI